MINFSFVIIKVKVTDLTKVKEYLLSHVKVLKHEKDCLTIKVAESDIKNLHKANVEYQILSYRGLKQAIHFLKSRFSIVIGVLIFLSIMYVNSISIKEISFSTFTPMNTKIKEIIETNLQNVGPLKFISGDINDINLVLRKEFSNFEWISVNKKGCVLYVTILQPSIINKQVEYVDGFGDIVAKKSGIVQFFQVSHGIPMIEQNLYVKEGQLLVSGNLRLNSDQSIFYIPASGKVYAEVWNTITIEVEKEKKETVYTGRVFTEKSLSLFGLDIKYKSGKINYKNYDIEIVEEKLKIFNITLPFSIKKIHYLEKNDIIKVYDKDSSKEYAQSSLRNELVMNFGEGDRILGIDILSQTEDDEKFTYVFFVRTYENIAVFKRRNMDE